MIAIGSHVRVNEPFKMAFPGVYEVTALANDTATICGDRQFDVIHLEETSDELEGWEPPAEETLQEKIARLQAEIVALAQQVG